MSERHGIIVGYDGSSNAVAAVEWARTKTSIFGAVRPVYAWSIPAMAIAGTPLGFSPAPPVEEMRAAAERAAAAFAADLGIDPDDVSVVQGDPGTVLCNAATQANLLVVGTRSRGPIRSNLLGSVGRDCADHAEVPLVIVPETDGPAPTRNRGIVVGVDGSANSIAGLRWAAANFTDTPITAVASWQTPIDGPVMMGGGRFDLKAFRAQAGTIVEEAAEKVTADLGLDSTRIARKIVEGDPRATLLAEQDTADLLVVGRRGRGGLAHLLVGSSTTSLIHQPRCPIAVIPPEEPHE